MNERLRRLGVPLVGGVAFALTATRTVQGGDAAELAAVGASGGVPHPPGYPLFVLWCRGWQWLPAASPGHRVALATAILGAVAIYLVDRSARAWGARALGAGIASILFAVAPLTWRLSTEPEVFILNAVLALALLVVAAPEPWEREERRAIALALLAGLGISNHHTIVLLAPIGLFAWATAVRRTPRRALAIAGSAGALALGLLPYAYLYAAAKSSCAWGDTSSLSGLLHHFLRRDYGTTQLASSKAEAEPLRQIAWLGWSFVESGIALVVLPALVLWRKRARAAHYALLASLLLAGPIFVSRFNLPPRGLMATVVVRFHLLPLALGCVLGAPAIDAVAAQLDQRLVRRLVAAGVFLALLGRAAFSALEVTAQHRPTTERYLRNALGSVPDNSIVIASGDDVVGGFEYMQCALGTRRDVVVVSPELMLSAAYGRRIEAKLGVPIAHGEKMPGEDQVTLDGTRLLKELIATGRPVFLTAWFIPSLRRSFPSYPIGPLIRVPADPREVPSPHALYDENVALFSRLELDETPPFAHTWAGVRYPDYARPWSVLADAFEAEGQQELATRCRARATSLTPLEP